MSSYTCYGPDRGQCGHRHRSILEAWRCLETERNACRVEGVDSDREVYLVDADGYLLDVERKPMRPAHEPEAGPIRLAGESGRVPVAVVQADAKALTELTRLGEAGSLEEAKRMASEAGYHVVEGDDQSGLIEARDAEGSPLYLVEVQPAPKLARAPRAAGHVSPTDERAAGRRSSDPSGRG